jgi:ribitol-5-phosphate 2-dehydrogenase (NADP+) / D-ribitol-5-phosphate cytidylyltransferase
MASAERTIGVILAGGTGSRVGLSIPKQLLKVAGKPVMEHTIEIFQDADSIDEIYIMMHPDHLEAAERIGRKFTKVTRILAGGDTRNDSTRAALRVLNEHNDPQTRVLFHDAVRPLLDIRIIDEVVAALGDYDAVDVAIPSADTIVEVNRADEVVSIPPRGFLRRGQTPQAFRLGILTDAYLKAWKDPEFVATDDCSVVLKYRPDVPIKVIEGADHNMKITEPIDVFIADKLFQIGSTMAPPPTDAEAYREKLAGKVVVILGGSYGIGADIAELAENFGAKAYAFSRSQTNTHVEEPAEVDAALSQVYAEAGRIDFLVVTAGVLNIGRLADVPMDDILNGIRVNFVAPVVAARAALPYLRETNGQLLLFTSSSYTRGRAEYSIYSSSKAAVVNLTQALADEWSADGVRVNCINPERTATPMRTKAFGVEPAETLLSSKAVALTSLDVLLSQLTGNVIDVRRLEPGIGAMSRSNREAAAIVAALEAAGGDLADNEF